MKRSILILLLIPIFSFGQISYSGYLGEQPITLVTYSYSDGVVRAFYAYDKFDTPIQTNGKLEGGSLTLIEKNEKKENLAVLEFPDFSEEKDSIAGKWIANKSKKEQDIILSKNIEITYGDQIEWPDKYLLQSASTKEHYFKAIINKEKGKFYARVIGVQIFEKKTDKLIQTIEVDCQLSGIDNVSVGDYNFDNVDDFSVFESSYAGPNTSSIYILRDPDSENYFKSGFEGTSLEFDNEEKLIYEHNQCCAGNAHMNAKYKVVDNTMVLIEKTCVAYNESVNEMVEVDCDE